MPPDYLIPDVTSCIPHASFTGDSLAHFSIGPMPDLRPENVASYLSAVLGGPVTVRAMTPLGKSADAKGYGYGTPIRVDYDSRAGRRVAVLHTISPGPFGHEHMSDRAAELLWEHRA